MFQLVNVFWQICLLKRAPQDVPASTTLLWLTLGVYSVIGFGVSLITLGGVAAFISSVVDMGLLAGLTFLVLWSRELTPRYVQTTTALAGTGAIMTALALPLLVMQAGLGQSAMLPSVFVLVLMVWNLNIMGHILRNALDAKQWVGLLLAVMYLYVSISVFRSIFAEPVVS